MQDKNVQNCIYVKLHNLYKLQAQFNVLQAVYILSSSVLRTISIQTKIIQFLGRSLLRRIKIVLAEKIVGLKCNTVQH